jgi:hypothetical protein
MALKAGSCSYTNPGWRGLLSVLLLLTTFSSHHYCAESSHGSNFINIDDDEDTTATTIALPTTVAAAVADTTSRSSIKFSSILAPPLSQQHNNEHNDVDNDEDDVTSIDSTILSSSTLSPSSSSSSPSSLFPSTASYEQQYSASSEANETPYQFNFTHPIYNVTIAENSVQKTLVVQSYGDEARMGIQLYAKDADRSIKAVFHIDVKYQIMDGDKNKIFKAEERIVGDFAFLTIRTRTNNIVLNREKGDNYRLRIKAAITRSSRIGTKRRETQDAEAIVDVKVLDRNDLSPLFYPTKYSITIADDTPLHQSILRVTAEDADLGINGGK